MAAYRAPSVTAVSLDEYFAVLDRPKVEAFLDDHPDVLPLVVRTAQAIGDYFPASVRLSLDVKDPSEGDETSELLVLVEADMDRAEAWKCLHEFRSKWWRPSAGQALGDAFVTLS